jgi:hypothetical protein
MSYYRTAFGGSFWMVIGTMAVLFFVTILFIPFIYSGYLIALFIILTVLLILAGYYTRYTFEKDELVVRCPLWFVEPPIPYSSVKKIEVGKIWVNVFWIFNALRRHLSRRIRLRVHIAGKQRRVRQNSEGKMPAVKVRVEGLIPKGGTLSSSARTLSDNFPRVRKF